MPLTRRGHCTDVTLVRTSHSSQLYGQRNELDLTFSRFDPLPHKSLFRSLASRIVCSRVQTFYDPTHPINTLAFLWHSPITSARIVTELFEGRLVGNGVGVNTPSALTVDGAVGAVERAHGPCVRWLGFVYHVHPPTRLQPYFHTPTQTL
jgi:hypothetical protein